MGWFTQSESEDTTVEVKAGESVDHGCPVTEIIIIDHTSGSGAHEHIVISDTGETLHDTTAS